MNLQMELALGVLEILYNKQFNKNQIKLGMYSYVGKKVEKFAVKRKRC